MNNNDPTALLNLWWNSVKTMFDYPTSSKTRETTIKPKPKVEEVVNEELLQKIEPGLL